MCAHTEGGALCPDNDEAAESKLLAFERECSLSVEGGDMIEVYVRVHLGRAGQDHSKELDRTLGLRPSWHFILLLNQHPILLHRQQCSVDAISTILASFMPESLIHSMADSFWEDLDELDSGSSGEEEENRSNTRQCIHAPLGILRNAPKELLSRLTHRTIIQWKPQKLLGSRNLTKSQSHLNYWKAFFWLREAVAISFQAKKSEYYDSMVTSNDLLVQIDDGSCSQSSLSDQNAYAR